SRGAGLGRVFLLEDEVDCGGVESPKHVIGLPHPGVPTLEGVGAAQESTDEVRSVTIKRMPLVGVEEPGEIAGDVGKAGSVEGARRERIACQVSTGRVYGRLIDIAGSLRPIPVFLIAEHIPEATRYHQLRSGRPVSAKCIDGQRIHGSSVTRKRSRIGGSGEIALAVRAIRIRQKARGPRITIVPAREQAQRVEHAVVQPRVSIVLREAVGELLGGDDRRDEICRAPDRIKRGNVACEEPQPIPYQWSADFETWFD